MVAVVENSIIETIDSIVSYVEKACFNNSFSSFAYMSPNNDSMPVEKDDIKFWIALITILYTE